MALGGLGFLPVGSTPTLCPFALVTGVACPGCGLTRAAAALVRGDFLAAWEFHPLVWVAAVWGVGAWTVGLMRSRGRSVAPSARLLHHLLIATGVVFLVTWVLRMATGTLPAV